MTAREALAQEWRERLEDFAESDLTVLQWCDFNRLSIHQYYYWRRRLATTKTQEPANPHFMPVQVVDLAPVCIAPGGVSIRIAGALIEVSNGFDPALLRAIVGALATPPC
jgi:hypothetical protein